MSLRHKSECLLIVTPIITSLWSQLTWRLLLPYSDDLLQRLDHLRGVVILIEDPDLEHRSAGESGNAAVHSFYLKMIEVSLLPVQGEDCADFTWNEENPFYSKFE